jgi:SAM-dependent methyltransferase
MAMSISERIGNHRLITRPAGALAHLVFNPRVGNFLGKYGYAVQTRMLGEREMPFIDWGYEEDPPMALPLAQEDEPGRYCIQLYHATASQYDISGKKVLEVSCGHGGGASYLVRTMRPASYTGLDLNGPGIAMCRRKYDLPGLDFIHGDAQAMPVDDASYDVLISVEAGHLYPRFRSFLAEVARVLRPGGHFLYADERARSDVAEWDAAIAAFPLTQLTCRVINDEVLRGMDGSSAPIAELIDTSIPKIFRGAAREFACLPGSRMYESMRTGNTAYRMYHFVKDAEGA